MAESKTEYSKLYIKSYPRMRTLLAVDFPALCHEFPPEVIREKLDHLCPRPTELFRYLSLENYNSHGRQY